MIDMAHEMDGPEGSWTPAGRCTIFVCDIVGFGDPHRVDHIQRYLRQELYARLRRAFDDSGTAFGDCYREDRGDGVIIIPPYNTPVETVLSSVIERLDAELRRQNEVASNIARIRLRAAVHAGEVHPDAYGIAGAAVNHAFRILEAPAFKQKVIDSAARLSVIASEHVYNDVVRHAMGLINPADYQRAEIESKETTTTGWIRVLGIPTAELAELSGNGRDPTVQGQPLGAGRPSVDVHTAGYSIPDISPDALFEIVEQLLDIPLMATERGRDRVVGTLRDDISRMISRQPQSRLDTYGIVETCADHPGGIQELLATLRRLSGPSISLQRVEQIVARRLR